MGVYTDICIERFSSFFVFVHSNCQRGRILWVVPPSVKNFHFLPFVHRNSYEVDAFCEGPLCNLHSHLLSVKPPPLPRLFLSYFYRNVWKNDHHPKPRFSLGPLPPLIRNQGIWRPPRLFGIWDLRFGNPSPVYSLGVEFLLRDWQILLSQDNKKSQLQKICKIFMTRKKKSEVSPLFIIICFWISRISISRNHAIVFSCSPNHTTKKTYLRFPIDDNTLPLSTRSKFTGRVFCCVFFDRGGGAKLYVRHSQFLGWW